MSNTLESFLERLDGSRYSTFVVAEYLHKRGYCVRVPAFDYRPKDSDWRDHVDDGDIYISKFTGGPEQRIDVKHLNTEFTSADDWPHSKVYIANAASVDRADPFPLAYILLNRSATHAAIVWGKTRPTWREATCFARNTKTKYALKYCEPQYVEFRKLDIRGKHD